MNRSAWLKIVSVAVVVIGVWWGLSTIGVDLHAWSPERIRTVMLAQGIWAPLIYLLVYGQPLVPLPASLMTLAGGLAFGPVWGTLGAVCGATIRASGQFLVARVLGREAVAGLLKGRAARLDEKIHAHGFAAVFFIRLIPSFLPFDVQNYALGCSKVAFGPYVLGTVLGLLPHCLVLVSLGYSLTDPRRLWWVALAVMAVVGLFWATLVLRPQQARSS